MLVLRRARRQVADRRQPVPEICLMEDNFRSGLGGTNDATVSITLNEIVGGVATYDLELVTPLQAVTIQTGDPSIDGVITITITGDIVARGQWRGV